MLSPLQTDRIPEPWRRPPGQIEAEAPPPDSLTTPEARRSHVLSAKAARHVASILRDALVQCYDTLVARVGADGPLPTREDYTGTLLEKYPDPRYHGAQTRHELILAHVSHANSNWQTMKNTHAILWGSHMEDVPERPMPEALEEYLQLRDTVVSLRPEREWHTPHCVDAFTLDVMRALQKSSRYTHGDVAMAGRLMTGLGDEHYGRWVAEEVQAVIPKGEREAWASAAIATLASGRRPDMQAVQTLKMVLSDAHASRPPDVDPTTWMQDYMKARSVVTDWALKNGDTVGLYPLASDGLRAIVYCREPGETLEEAATRYTAFGQGLLERHVPRHLVAQIHIEAETEARRLAQTPGSEEEHLDRLCLFLDDKFFRYGPAWEQLYARVNAWAPRDAGAVHEARATIPVQFRRKAYDDLMAAAPGPFQTYSREMEQWVKVVRLVGEKLGDHPDVPGQMDRVFQLHLSGRNDQGHMQWLSTVIEQRKPGQSVDESARQLADFQSRSDRSMHDSIILYPHVFKADMGLDNAADIVRLFHVNSDQQFDQAAASLREATPAGLFVQESIARFEETAHRARHLYPSAQEVVRFLKTATDAGDEELLAVLPTFDAKPDASQQTQRLDELRQLQGDGETLADVMRRFDTAYRGLPSVRRSQIVDILKLVHGYRRSEGDIEKLQDMVTTYWIGRGHSAQSVGSFIDRALAHAERASLPVDIAGQQVSDYLWATGRMVPDPELNARIEHLQAIGRFPHVPIESACQAALSHLGQSKLLGLGPEPALEHAIGLARQQLSDSVVPIEQDGVVDLLGVRLTVRE